MTGGERKEEKESKEAENKRRGIGAQIRRGIGVQITDQNVLRIL